MFFKIVSEKKNGYNGTRIATFRHPHTWMSADSSIIWDQHKPRAQSRPIKHWPAAKCVGCRSHSTGFAIRWQDRWSMVLGGCWLKLARRLKKRNTYSSSISRTWPPPSYYVRTYCCLTHKSFRKIPAKRTTNGSFETKTNSKNTAHLPFETFGSFALQGHVSLMLSSTKMSVRIEYHSIVTRYTYHWTE